MTSGTEADGEIVWFWHARASAKFVTMLRHRTGDGDNARFTGKSAYKP